MFHTKLIIFFILRWRISHGNAAGDVDLDGYPDVGVANSDAVNEIYIAYPAR